ncbi:MAG TPA: LacI family DNA-binding transcriptional regulator [Gemmatimonadaceae bacterium]|nr:LacI family DNA-binding transcriptional regulator [Gemmatimonadaceae bacterium]
MKTTSSGAPTIQQVAELARVSPATVSRVLNGSTKVRDDHRRRVLAAVEQIDYRPNRLARNLRRQQAETIGVVVPDIENPHFSEAVRVVEDAAFQRGYRLLLCNTDETRTKQHAYLQVLADERVLGVIVASADRSGIGLDLLFDLGIPVVAFDRLVDDDRVDAVSTDNSDAARRATEHLIWLGHTRIAYVGGRNDVGTGAERQDGYLAAMRAARRTPFTFNGGFRADVAEREVATVLRVSERPTAIVVANNLMAIGTLRAIRAAELRVPADVALVAIDDPPWAALVDPPLTVIAQPVRQMAESAITLLLERVERRRNDPVRVVLPFDLRIRESCGMRASAPEERRGA